jgi:hypothetical protein
MNSQMFYKKIIRYFFSFPFKKSFVGWMIEIFSPTCQSLPRMSENVSKSELKLSPDG